MKPINLSKLNIPDKIKKEIENFMKEIKANDLSPKSVILFGSYAKNTWSENSDIDLCVVDNYKKKEYLNKLLEYDNLKFKTSNSISVVLMNEKDIEDTANPLVYEIRKSGIKVA